MKLTNNYLRWTASYTTFVIQEDETIADHFLKLVPENLEKISFQDGLTSYSLLVQQGLFCINQDVLTIQSSLINLSKVKLVAKKILKPYEEFLTDGVFQYKHCSADSGPGGSCFLGTYNLGFRKTLGSIVTHQVLRIDSRTGLAEVTITNSNAHSNRILEKGTVKLN